MTMLQAYLNPVVAGTTLALVLLAQFFSTLLGGLVQSQLVLIGVQFLIPPLLAYGATQDRVQAVAVGIMAGLPLAVLALADINLIAMAA